MFRKWVISQTHQLLNVFLIWYSFLLTDFHVSEHLNFKNEINSQQDQSRFYQSLGYLHKKNRNRLRSDFHLWPLNLIQAFSSSLNDMEPLSVRSCSVWENQKCIWNLADLFPLCHCSKMFQLGKTIFKHDKVKIVKLSLQQTRDTDTNVQEEPKVSVSIKLISLQQFDPHWPTMIEIVYVYAVHNHVVIFYSPLSSVFVDVDGGWFLCFVSGVSAGLARGAGLGRP